MREIMPVFQLNKLPFAFSLDGVEHRGFDGFAELSCETREDAAKGVETQCAEYRLADSLKATVELTLRPKWDQSEFVVWFENDGAAPSPVIENPRALLRFEGRAPLLSGIMGDSINHYRPYMHDLTERAVRFSCDSGRATHVDFPYFDLTYGYGGYGGAFLAIGWAGTWMADFDWDGKAVICELRAVNGLRTRLLPGERIRTASYVMLPYSGRDRNAAMIRWRRWFVSEVLPKANADGAPFEPISTACLANDTGLPNSDGSISERSTTWRPSMEKQLAEGIAPDVRWFDAGWYVAPDGTSPESDWWGTVGTWRLSPEKWPGDSFRQSTDFARAHGMKTLMWFEPERVTDVDNLVKNYGYRREWAIANGDRVISNNIGDPDCYRWTVDRICATLRENRVEIYREDNNSNQARLWNYLDSREGDDRRGITECKFIMAHYSMWDEIIACTLSYGGCGYVDSCAGGGGRNDIESLRRGIPFLRSDSDRVSTGMRLATTTAFSRWIPACGALTSECKAELDPNGVHDMYIWRASYLPVLNIDSKYVHHETQDFSIIRQGLEEWKKLKYLLLKDMYVLTPWHFSGDTTGMTAFAYVDEDALRGCVLAFRQENCRESELRLRLPVNGIDALTDADTGAAIPFEQSARGCEFTLSFEQPRTARLIWISLNMRLTEK